MPCKKCKDGKYKWGNTGECKYATKDECEKANPKKYNKMNPTPLGKKTYEEYAKELKEFNLSKVERVELAIVDDLKELISDSKRIIGLQEDGFKWGEKAEAQLKEVKKVISDAEGITRGAIRQAGNLKTESDKIFNKLEVSAKELGIKPNSIKGYDTAIKQINEMFENQNALNGWNELLKKML